MMNAPRSGAAVVDRHRSVEPGPVFTLGIATIVADAGYLSEDNINASGPQRLIAIGKQHTVAQAAKGAPAQGPSPPPPARLTWMGGELTLRVNSPPIQHAPASTSPALKILQGQLVPGLADC